MPKYDIGSDNFILNSNTESEVRIAYSGGAISKISIAHDGIVTNIDSKLLAPSADLSFSDKDATVLAARTICMQAYGGLEDLYNNIKDMAEREEDRIRLGYWDWGEHAQATDNIPEKKKNGRYHIDLIFDEEYEKKYNGSEGVSFIVVIYNEFFYLGYEICPGYSSLLKRGKFHSTKHEDGYSDRDEVIDCLHTVLNRTYTLDTLTNLVYIGEGTEVASVGQYLFNIWYDADPEEPYDVRKCLTELGEIRGKNPWPWLGGSTRCGFRELTFKEIELYIKEINRAAKRGEL